MTLRAASGDAQLVPCKFSVEKPKNLLVTVKRCL